MDLESLLQSHGEDAPSGEDLEYDPVFTDLEIAAQPGEERQVGDEIIPGEDPDYKEVVEKATDIMSRSHDLRAAVYMAEAQLKLNGFPGFAKVTSYMAGLLTEYWTTCHPQLDEDDDDDPTMRINTIAGLCGDPDGQGGPSRVYQAARRAPLTKSRAFGLMSLRHIAVADGDMTPPADMEDVPDAGQIAAAFQDTDDDELREIADAISQAVEDLGTIDAAFSENTPGQGPNIDPLIKQLKTAQSRLAGALGDPVDGETEVADDDADGDAPSASPIAAGGGGSGAINSPTDVRNTIDRIIAYYERVEPSSPVPILLVRAKKLVGADFLTIMKDMAPGGVENVNHIGGIETEDEY